MKSTKTSRNRSAKRSLIGLLLSCPAKGFFIPIASESTDTIRPLFEASPSCAERRRNYLGLVAFCIGCWIISSELLRAGSPAGHIYLSGELNHQGAVEIPEGGKITITQAIIAEGGLGPIADSRHITVLRKKSDGSSQVIHVDWIAIVGGGDQNHPASAHLEKDVPLKAGDTIVVPKKVANF